MRERLIALWALLRQDYALPESGRNPDNCTLALTDHTGEALRQAAHVTIWSRCPRCRVKSPDWRACDRCLSIIAGIATGDVNCKQCGYTAPWSQFHEVVRDRA